MTRPPTRGLARAAASLLGCVALAGCGDGADVRASREAVADAGAGPATPAPTSTPAPDTSPAETPDDGDTVLDTTPIARYLEPGAYERVTLDDGERPILEGSWLRPTVNDSWTWQLQGPLVTKYEVDWYVIDMFSTLGRDSIERLRAEGRNVLCYFSAGTYEPWRPDVHFFDEADLGPPHLGFPDEPWLDPADEKIMRIMANRMDMAVAIGCDGVELDNVDAFVQETGFDVTREEQVRFVKILANEAHERNLTVALKNSVELIAETKDWFDLAINEQCFERPLAVLDPSGVPTGETVPECVYYEPLTRDGKPVFGAEYRPEVIDDPVERERMCVQARRMNMRTLMLPHALDGSFRYSCDDG